jgi:hypothetical protein
MGRPAGPTARAREPHPHAGRPRAREADPARPGWPFGTWAGSPSRAGHSRRRPKPGRSRSGRISTGASMLLDQPGGARLQCFA